MSSQAYRENYALIEWHTPDEPKQIKKNVCRGGPYYMSDIAEFVSPVGYEHITSRSQLREHERRHGIRQCGELKTPGDFDNGARRQSAFNERSFDRAFRAAVEKTGA